MSVLVFGSVNIDRSFRLPHWIECGETIASLSLSTQAGGKGANQAVALSKAGTETYLASTIGSDGLWIRDILDSYGVNTSLMAVKEKSYTGTATILLDEKGRNSIVLYGGGNRENDESYIGSVLSHFGEGDWIVLQNEINNLGLIIDRAKQRGMKICLNPSPFEESLLSLNLGSVDLIVVNEIEIMQLMNGTSGSWEDIISSCAERYPSSSILLTLGEEGSIYKDKGAPELIKTPIVKTTVVDTTAAGDTFLGYFLSGILKGNSPRESLRRATKASSVAVSRAGAMDSIPYSDEIV